MRGSRRLAAAFVAALVPALLQLAPAPGSAVEAKQPEVVSATPSAATPDVNDGVVYAIGQVGSTTIAGGSFTSVSSPGGGTTYAVTDIAAFGAHTGNVHPGFAPRLDGAVNAIIPGPSPGTVYVGGSFTHVDGVAARLALLDVSTGRLVGGWRAPSLNGAVNTLVLSHGRLYVGGFFSSAGGKTRHGLVTLDPTSGAVTGYSTLAFTGHHNYGRQCDPTARTCANGGVGVKSLDVDPRGTRMVVIGNFVHVSGTARDQVAMVKLGAAATLDTSWATDAYTAPCLRSAYDSDVRQVQFAPDGSYFVIAATGSGGPGSLNSDGTRSSCDAVSRYETSGTGTDVRPSWIDYTGNDTLWSVAVTGTAVYVGGHERWLNNSHGQDDAQAGAVPRPGVAAIDPLNGMPLAWNPGRNPRGQGAYALLATPDGLYVGSDTEWIGNQTYQRKRIAFFPLAGGSPPPVNRVGTLPGDVYLVDPVSDPAAVDQSYWDGSTAPGPTAVQTSVDWSTVRGAFAVDGTVYYGTSDGSFRSRSYDGRSFGQPVTIDPYDDPAWSDVQTGSGQTYRGVPSDFSAEIPSLTSMFYVGGRVYYTLTGSTQLFWRWFESDDGVMGADEFTSTGGLDWSHVAGAFVAGPTMFFGDSTTGDLDAVAFRHGEPSGAPRVVDTSRNWAAAGIFALSPSQVSDTAPTAAFGTTCSATSPSCTVDGSGSVDPDGTLIRYTWRWGDGRTTTTSTPTAGHDYAEPGNYTISLTVTDNEGVTSSSDQSIHAGVPTAAFRAARTRHADTSAARIRIPRRAVAGDQLVLLASYASTSATARKPSGWKQDLSRSRRGLTSVLYRRRVAADDPGSTVTVRFPQRVRASMLLLDYSRAAVDATGSRTAVDVHRLSSPRLHGLAGGSIAVTFWTGTGHRAPEWSPPSGVTARASVRGAGAGSVGALAAESATAVAASYGHRTATTGPRATSAAAFTVVLRSTG